LFSGVIKELYLSKINSCGTVMLISNTGYIRSNLFFFVVPNFQLHNDERETVECSGRFFASCDYFYRWCVNGWKGLNNTL